MKCVSYKPKYRNYVQAVIVADETPEVLPTTGEGIGGMNAADRFAPFSILFDATTYNASGEYIVNSSGGSDNYYVSLSNGVVPACKIKKSM